MLLSHSLNANSLCARHTKKKEKFLFDTLYSFGIYLRTKYIKLYMNFIFKCPSDSLTECVRVCVCVRAQYTHSASLLVFFKCFSSYSDCKTVQFTVIQSESNWREWFVWICLLFFFLISHKKNGSDTSDYLYRVCGVTIVMSIFIITCCTPSNFWNILIPWNFNLHVSYNYIYIYVMQNIVAAQHACIKQRITTTNNNQKQIKQHT